LKILHRVPTSCAVIIFDRSVKVRPEIVMDEGL